MKRIVVILVMLTGLSLWLYRPNTLVAAELSVGSAAPPFELVSETGKPVSLSDYAGKVVVLEWTNPDCPFVKRHYKEGTMNKLADSHADRGVVWLTINSTRSATVESNRVWKEQQGFNHLVLDDSAGAVGRLYGAKTTPHMFIIDTEGRLRYQGAIDSDPSGDEQERVNHVAVALQEILAGKPVTVFQTKPYGCSVKYRS